MRIYSQLATFQTQVENGGFPSWLKFSLIVSLAFGVASILIFVAAIRVYSKDSSNIKQLGSLSGGTAIFIGVLVAAASMFLVPVLIGVLQKYTTLDITLPGL